MIRSVKTAFRTSKTDLDRLFSCNRESALTWNDCLDHAKKYHEATGRWISVNDLQRLTKGRYYLHSQSIQSVQERYLEARKNAQRAKQAGNSHIRYPWRLKRNYPTRWKKDGFKILPNSKIQLSMGIHDGKRAKPIVVHCCRIPEGTIKEIELVWDRKLILAISYDDGLLPQPNDDQGLAAIDMGEIHGIASIAETGEALVISSRKLRSVKRLRNKKYKELYQRRSRCKKGSRQWRKYTRTIARIGGKTDNQQRDILHKTSRMFVDWVNKQGVKTVVVGDVEGIQRNTSGRKKANSKNKRRSRRQNQKMSQWPFGLLMAYLTYKLAAFSIELVGIDESFTTQTCPVCGRKRKPSGRIYECHCGYRCHRDVHGAGNIMSKHKHGDIRSLDCELRKITYLRPVA